MTFEEYVTEANAQKAHMLRTNMPGFVGADFAKVADDADLLSMADLKDAAAALHNKMVALRKKYKLK